MLGWKTRDRLRTVAKVAAVIVYALLWGFSMYLLGIAMNPNLACSI